MQKPQAIKLFDILYLASLAIVSGGFVLQEIETGTGSKGLLSDVMMMAAALSALFVLPWYFSSPKHQNGGKWVNTIFCVLGVLAAAYLAIKVFATPYTGKTGVYVQAAGWLVQAFAVVQLFTAGGKAWFAQQPYRDQNYGGQTGYPPQQGGYQQGYHPPQQQPYQPRQGFPGQPGYPPHR